MRQQTTTKDTKDTKKLEANQIDVVFGSVQLELYMQLSIDSAAYRLDSHMGTYLRALRGLRGEELAVRWIVESRPSHKVRVWLTAMRNRIGVSTLTSSAGGFAAPVTR